MFAAGVAAERGAGGDGPGSEGGALLTGGGRVLDVVGLGPDLPEARRVAYRAADMISWPGMLSRSDIAGGIS